MREDVLSGVWSTGALLEAVLAGLAEREGELREAQAVHGLDALSETEIHPLLAACFRRAGFGVFPEQPYPGRPGSRPRRSQRERCDLVLTPAPDSQIVDPVAVLAERDKAAQTLFGGATLPAIPAGCEPADACWVEVKSIGQNAYQRGVPGPNRGYSGELLQGVSGDVAKLARAEGIRHAFAMAAVFAGTEESARHDIEVVIRRCLDKGHYVREWELASVPVTDRIGNRVCVVGMLRVVPASGVP